MILFAELSYDPRGFVTWLAIGLVVGWCAGKLTESPSYGPIGDLIVGVLGALIGGFASGYFVASGSEYLLSLPAALLGACVLIGIARVVMSFRPAD